MRKVRYNRLSNQIVGNAGLYFICYKLSKLGWNVLPTSRNTKGVDIVIFSRDGKRMHTVQVKSLSKNPPVPFGNSLNGLISEYLIICRNVSYEVPEIYISETNKIRNYIRQGRKEGRSSYWLRPNDYVDFKDKWNIIGRGFD